MHFENQDFILIMLALIMAAAVAAVIFEARRNTSVYSMEDKIRSEMERQRYREPYATCEIFEKLTGILHMREIVKITGIEGDIIVTKGVDKDQKSRIFTIFSTAGLVVDDLITGEWELPDVLPGRVIRLQILTTEEIWAEKTINTEGGKQDD